jgi:subtilisin family serine protease
MKKYFLPTLVLLACFILGFKGNDNQSKNRTHKIDPNIVPNTVIVKMKVDPKDALLKGDGLNKFNAILDNCKMESFEKIFPHKQKLLKSSPESIDLSKFYILKYSEDISPYEVIQALSKNELVEYAEPKYIRKIVHSPNDIYFASQWALKNIEAERAWDISRGSKEVIIGIVDTGVDWLHEDLADNIWINKNEIPNNGIDDDNNGYIDDVRGWDFGGLGNGTVPTPDNDPNEDRPDHGTHVAGIASGVTNNGTGIAGVGYNCSIMPVKVSQDNQRNPNNQTPYVIFGYEGIVYAADNGASIINCSWGGGGYSRFEDEVIQYANQKGAVIVAAAGNDGRFMSNSYPASYNHVIAVASTDQNDVRSYFSNWGYYVNISAPGSSILNTWKGNSYTNLNGTSMATPHVAGVAGLVKATFPHYTPDQIIQRIRMSADNIDDKNPFFKGLLGSGRLNAYRALTISSPAVRIVSKELEDSNGNVALELGEKVKLIITVKNYLDPVHNLEVSLSSTSNYINVTQESFNLGALGTLEEASNIAIPFEFEIAENTPTNTEVHLIINYRAENYEDKEEAFSINLNPSYLNTDVSKISMTVTSEGNIGFNDFPDNEQGIGFVYDDGDNLLFEGSLMLATSANRVSDVARNNNINEKNIAFKTITPIHFSNDDLADETSETIFNDAEASSPIGIQTTLNTYAFKNEPYNKFVILKYTYKNTNTSGTINFSSGLFFDWDLDEADNNVVKYDPSTLMGYVYTTNDFPTYAGVALLSVYDKVNFWPILNSGDSRWGIYEGFSDAKKYQSLTGGVDRESAGPGDISFVIGPGSISLAADKESTSYYAMVAGNSLDELREAVYYAKQKLNTIDVNVPEPIPLEYALLGNYPNPFNPSTNIKFRLKEKGNIRIDIYDVKGSVVSKIEKKDVPAGDNSIVVNMGNRATGAYYYRFRVFNERNERVFEKSSKFMMIR